MLGRRELLVHLVVTDLRLRYRNSILGFLWTLLTPALTLAVFGVVFTVVLKGSYPYYWLYLLAGLTVWNLFSSALTTGTSAIVANAAILRKAALPGPLFVVASTLSALINSLFQFAVLGVVVAVLGRPVSLSFLVLLVPAAAVLLCLATGASLMLAVHNVRYRDVRYLVDVLLLPWFWLTPLVYPYGLLANRVHNLSWLPLLNPVTIVVVVFQRALYAADPTSAGSRLLPPGGVGWYATRLGIVGVVAVVLLYGAARWTASRHFDVVEDL